MSCNLGVALWLKYAVRCNSRIGRIDPEGQTALTARYVPVLNVGCLFSFFISYYSFSVIPLIMGSFFNRQTNTASHHSMVNKW